MTTLQKLNAGSRTHLIMQEVAQPLKMNDWHRSKVASPINRTELIGTILSEVKGSESMDDVSEVLKK